MHPTIILFGSKASGYDVETSDNDLVVITERTREFERLSEFEKRIGKTLQLFVVKNLKELMNEHLINNVLGGIVLQGEIRWMSKSAKERVSSEGQEKTLTARNV